MDEMTQPQERTKHKLLIVQDSRNKLEKTIVYMETNFKRAITREQLAAIAELNPEHYSRVFRKYMGVSPIEYLTRLRMEKAKELLQRGQHSIIEIGQMVGYTDPYHFSRRFKQAVGVAPAHYSRELVPRVVAVDGYGYCQALGIEPIVADLHTSAIQSSLDRKQLEELQPDIILTASSEWEQPLAAIAPVMKLDVLQDPIYHQLLAVAIRLGRYESALDWIRKYEAQCAELRQQLAERLSGKRVAILRVREQLLQVYGMLNMGYPLYRSLQLSPPEKIALQSLCNTHYHSSAISIEELPFYEAEHLFVVLQPDIGAHKQWELITQTEAWRNYPAVRLGNIYHVQVADWLPYDPTSIMMQMREAAELLTTSIR